MKSIHLSMAIMTLASWSCSPGESPQSEPVPEEPYVAARSAALKDVCELLPAEQLGALVGVANVVAKPDRYENEWSSCEYRDPAAPIFPGVPPDEQTPLLLLRIYWSGGQELWEMELGARQVAAELLEEPDVSAEEIAEIVEPGPVAGLGDAAHFNELLGSYVLVGDTLLQFIMPLMTQPATRFRPIASAVLSRL